MNVISSYKKELKSANKQLTEDEKDLLKVKEEIAALQKTEKKLEKRVEEDRQNKVEKGLLYFSNKKRLELLDRAENFPYSRETLSRLRSFDKDHWNSDCVDCDIIADFEGLEKYVNRNTPAWERSSINKIGEIFNQSE